MLFYTSLLAAPGHNRAILIGFEKLGVNVPQLSEMLDLELRSLAGWLLDALLDEVSRRPPKFLGTLAVVERVICIAG